MIVKQQVNDDWLGKQTKNGKSEVAKQEIKAVHPSQV
jgi:hypothetical protein